MTHSTVFIGTSGYQYNHWKGFFYPSDLPKQQWFDYYARHFDTVEINNTFYRLPEAHTFETWREQAPPGFCYSVKFSRFGTHLKHLKDPRSTIGLYLERAGRLQDSLGPTLVQLPPRWKPDPARLNAFLDEALDARPRKRWTVEFRHPDWLCDEVYAILERHDAALCIHDMIADHPRRLTADWTYLRFHGGHYDGDYSHQFLSAEARRISAWLDQGLDVYAYFNNDLHGHAVHNAADLKRYLQNGGP